MAVLRVVAGIALIAQSVQYSGPATAPATAWVSGLVILAAGCLLVAGLVTPVAVSLVFLWGTAVAVSLLPPPMPNLFDSGLSLVFGATMLLAIAGMGPGAFSADARLFGRREIIIPRER